MIIKHKMDTDSLILQSENLVNQGKYQEAADFLIKSAENTGETKL